MSGYWLILADEVTDEKAQQIYAQLWKPISDKYKAKLTVLDPGDVLVETKGFARVLVVEFDSHETAVACYRDEAYQAAKEFAVKAARRELLILKGSFFQP